MDQINKKELKIIYQFLVGNNFESTAGALITEALNRGFANLELESNSKDVARVCEQIIFYFKEGDQNSFFKLWNLSIPEDIKKTKEFKILALNLYVHFAVFPKRIMLARWSEEKHKTESSNGNSYESKEIENFIAEIEKNMSDNMDQLRQYLNTAGKELECEAQLRPFFALPFIEDPYAEPFLSKIFHASWLDELTENLRAFIDKHKRNFNNFGGPTHDNENSNKPPSLCESLLPEQKENANAWRKVVLMNNNPIVPNDRDIPVFLEDSEIGEQYTLSSSVKYNRKSKSTQTHVRGIQFLTNSHKDDANDKKMIQYTQELAVTKSHLCTVHCNYEKLKVRFHKLHADYHKLISVAGELTAALENSVKGQTVDLQSMLETCIQIFPDLFNQNVRDLGSQISSASQIDKLYAHTRTIDHSALDITSVSPKLLDFQKIKSHLISGSIKTKLFLLQALRRKITLGQPGERDEAIHEYISKDLLGLHGQIASDNGKSILPYLLAPGNITPHPLQQSAARLLNVLSSFRCGRDYLSYGSIVVNVILKCLSNASNNDVDAITCNMMIAMLQKLSLRKQQRIYMIDNGLLEWLIRHLHDECRLMDSYRLEYATALLMNLSLHRMAQRRASVMASLLISTLLTLLSMNHVPAIPYVNGALNNFLTSQAINDKAKEVKLATALEYYRKNKTEEIQKHFDHILKIHRGDSTVKVEGEETADDDNEEFDVLENELEENDPVRNCTSELCGEMLLATCYAFSPKSVQERNLIADASPLRNYRIHTIRVHDNQRQDVILCDDHQSAACKGHFLPRESSKTTVGSSTILTPAGESGAAEVEKLSSIASLNLVAAGKNSIDSTPWAGQQDFDNEEAFLAKPKLSRTPPRS